MKHMQTKFSLLSKENLRIKKENLKLKVRLEQQKNVNSRQTIYLNSFTVVLTALFADFGFTFTFCLSEIFGAEFKLIELILLLFSILALLFFAYVIWRKCK